MVFLKIRAHLTSTKCIVSTNPEAQSEEKSCSVKRFMFECLCSAALLDWHSNVLALVVDDAVGCVVCPHFHSLSTKGQSLRHFHRPYFVYKVHKQDVVVITTLP